LPGQQRHNRQNKKVESWEADSREEETVKRNQLGQKEEEGWRRQRQKEGN
jgi:hypothetical protein